MMLSLLFHKKHRNFLRLWMAQLISQFGDRINQLALVGLIAERSPGSVFDLAKLLAFTILPVFVVQPFAGVFVDRWDRRTTLFICDIVRGALVLMIPFAFMYRASMVPIYIIVFLTFCFSRFYVPAKLSIIPDIVPKGQLLVANSLVTVTGMIAFVLGCAAGGFLIDYFGARNGFIVDSATFFISALFLLSMHLPQKLKDYRTHVLSTGRHIVGTIRQPVWQELKEGFLYLKQHREIRFIIDMLFILFAAAGALYVVIIVFIQKSFQSVTKDLGILAVFLGAGLFCGAILYGRFGKRFIWYKTIFFCLIAAGFMLILFAVLVSRTPNLVVASSLAYLLGAIIGPIFVAANTIVHVVSEDAMRGKVFSALEIITHLAFLATMLLTSWLSHFIQELWILVGAGLIFMLVGLIGMGRSQKFKTFALR
ncbi:MAG TPA: MFS transporter [Candidatus Omnitrophota bacterium]|nr:MFS transporter [Candidatus Omnitrophota bacterium]